MILLARLVILALKTLSFFLKACHSRFKGLLFRAKRGIRFSRAARQPAVQTKPPRLAPRQFLPCNVSDHNPTMNALKEARERRRPGV